MSACMVNSEVATVLVAAGLGRTNAKVGNIASEPLSWFHAGDDSPWHKLTRAEADRVGGMLLAECARSVSYRYDLPNRHHENGISELAGYMTEALAYRYPVDVSYSITAAELVGTISCFEYQSCETPDWPETEAFSYCRALKERLIRHEIGHEGWGDWDAATLAARSRQSISLSGMS